MTTEGPLHGIRVLEVADHTGAYAGRLLSDLGADIVKVEPPSGDPTRRWPPYDEHEPSARGQSLWFQHYNAGKRSVTLSLDHPDSAPLMHALVRASDAVLVAGSPAWIERHGLTLDDLRAVRADVITVSITPFGFNGPYRDRLDGDLILMAMAGLMYLCGEPDREPLRWGGEQSLHVPSLYATSGLLLALEHRAATGHGQGVEVAAFEALAPLFGESGRLQAYALAGEVAQRQGQNRAGAYPYGSFVASDGYVALGVNNDAQWQALAHWINEVTGEEAILDPIFGGTLWDRARYQDVLEPMLESFLSRLTRRELFESGQNRGVPIFPVNRVEELFTDPHLAAQGGFLSLTRPDGTTWHDAPHPFHFSRSSNSAGRPAPELPGEDNESIYATVGLDRVAVEQLRALGAI
ncbi:MAG: CaiB/BaiF CoA transferase family protein [Candidatus Limnocylindrales bacterium]